jgi:exosome complex RNA-binding protein Rrp42 (RNase PH superfamily)
MCAKDEGARRTEHQAQLSYDLPTATHFRSCSERLAFQDQCPSIEWIPVNSVLTCDPHMDEKKIYMRETNCVMIKSTIFYACSMMGYPTFQREIFNVQRGCKILC